MEATDLLRGRLDRLEGAVQALNWSITANFQGDPEGWGVDYIVWNSYLARFEAFYADHRSEWFPVVRQETWDQLDALEGEYVSLRRSYERRTGETLPPYTPWSAAQSPPPSAAPGRLNTGRAEQGISDLGVGIGVAALIALAISRSNAGGG